MTAVTHRVDVGDAELHVEVRGDGPLLVFVHGILATADFFAPVADRLAATRTTVTYDRRGNGRSTVTRGATTTDVAQQADDAAAVLEAVGARAGAPAVVYGNSAGACIAVETALRHPALLRGVLAHEPMFTPLLPPPSPGAPGLPTAPQVRTDPRAAARAVARPGMGADVYDSLADDARERMLAGALWTFTVELPGIAPYLPDPARLAAVAVPLTPVVGDAGPVFHHIGARWLAERTAMPLRTITGGHAPHLEDPTTFARDVMSLLGPSRRGAAVRR